MGRLTLAMLFAAASACSAAAVAQSAAPVMWSATPTVTTVAEPKTFRSGDATLSGTLYLPKGGHALGAVVVTHAASSPLQEAVLYDHLKQMLPPMGIAVFVYDRRGTGHSGGDAKATDYPMLADDAISAVKMLKADARVDPKRVGIWGLSQGGWLSLLAAARSPEVRFVVSISAPVVTPDVQMMFFSANALRIAGYPQTEIDEMLAARKAVDAYMRGTGDQATAQRMVDAVKDRPWYPLTYMGKVIHDRTTSGWRKEIEYDPLPTLDQIKVPSLILYGTADPVVPVATSVARIAAKPHPGITLHVVNGADHGMESSVAPKDQIDPAKGDQIRPDASEYFGVLASWLTQQGIARQ